VIGHVSSGQAGHPAARNWQPVPPTGKTSPWSIRRRHGNYFVHALSAAALPRRRPGRAAAKPRFFFNSLSGLHFKSNTESGHVRFKMAEYAQTIFLYITHSRVVPVPTALSMCMNLENLKMRSSKIPRFYKSKIFFLTFLFISWSFAALSHAYGAPSYKTFADCDPASIESGINDFTICGFKATSSITLKSVDEVYSSYISVSDSTGI
jgi:hypothetical protein